MYYDFSMNYFERAREFRAKKRLGQNFLIDESVIDLIVESSELSQDDVVVEIGSGLGFVTEKLVDKAKKIFAIELDEDAIKILSKLESKNLEIVHNDVLKTDFSQFGKNLKVIANIPYYITSPILVHLLGEIDDINNQNRQSISKIMLMVQKEVAQRLVATEKSPAKQYGLLSILTQFYADVKIIDYVKAKSFFPSPKVDSAIVELTIRKEPAVAVDDFKFFKRVVKSSFATRRKNIKNNLLNAGFKKENVEASLEKLGLPFNLRGETLSIKQFNDLAKELKEYEQNSN